MKRDKNKQMKKKNLTTLTILSRELNPHPKRNKLSPICSLTGDEQSVTGMPAKMLTTL